MAGPVCGVVKYISKLIKAAMYVVAGTLQLVDWMWLATRDQ